MMCFRSILSVLPVAGLILLVSPPAESQTLVRSGEAQIFSHLNGFEAPGKRFGSPGGASWIRAVHGESRLSIRPHPVPRLEETG